MHVKETSIRLSLSYEQCTAMISLVSIAIFIMGIYLMNRFFFGFQPGSSKINSDVGRFRNNAIKFKDELIQWDEEEFALFSLTQKNQVTKRGFGKSFEGVIQSIYHEPMLYYYYKEYPATKKNAILFAQSARYEIVIRIRAKNAQVFVNENFLGALQPDGTLLQDNGRTIAGRINRSNPYLKEIYVGEKMMGSVVLPSEATSVSHRAFDMDEKMNEAEQLIFMVLGIHEVIHFLTHTKRSSS